MTPSIKTLRAIFGENAAKAKEILLIESWKTWGDLGTVWTGVTA
jgi:hypothetical protein